jgi:hypothetical protein
MRDLRTTVLLGAALLGIGLAAPARADQPHMDKALNLLRQARNQLQAAETNKGGHRDKAIEATDRAINQVQAGIEYAKTHRDKD